MGRPAGTNKFTKEELAARAKIQKAESALRLKNEGSAEELKLKKLEIKELKKELTKINEKCGQ